MDTLVTDPALPASVLATLWIAAALVCVLYAFWRPTRMGAGRRVAIALFHFITFSAIILVLYRPTWLRLTTQAGKQPILSVLFDSSASMATHDASGGKTRMEESVALIRQNLPSWTREFDVRVSRFDKIPQRLQPEALQKVTADGGVSDVAGAVLAAVGEPEKPSALLMLTDGIHNAPDSDLDAAARTARAAAVPIFTVPIGTDVAVRDIGISVSSAEELAFVNQKARLGAVISQTGFNNTEVEVKLKQGDEVLGTKSVRFNENAEASIEFEVVRDKTGLYMFDMQVQPLKNEALLSNNQRRVALRVINERVRILFIEGKPYWDSKFLTRVLRRDPNVLLTTATLLRSDRLVIEPPTAEELGIASKAAWRQPKDPLKPLEDRSFLAQFNVLLVGNDAGTFFNPVSLETVRDWISRSGGHMVCTRGRPANDAQMPTGLASVLPVEWASGDEARYSMKLTERGRALSLLEGQSDPDVILDALPSLVTATRVEKERALSVVLARGRAVDGKSEPMAVLSMQNYGSGKSIVLEGQGMWRWAFRPPNDALKGEDLFRAFWTNMVRWLAGSNDFLPSQTIVLRPGKPLYQLGERPNLYVLQREGIPGAPTPEKTPQVELLNEGTGETVATVDGRSIPREPLMKEVEFWALPEGRYRARMVKYPQIECVFEILPPLSERLDVRARPEWLRRLSEMSDGVLIEPDKMATLSNHYRSYMARNSAGREIRRPAWDSPWFLAVLMCWPAATWYVRRRWGAI